MKRFLASVSLAVLAIAAQGTSPLLSPFGASIAQAQSAVTLENVTVKGEKSTMTMPKMVFEGTTASKAELEALFDPKNTAELGKRLARISASSVTIPVFELRQATPEATSLVIYRDVAFRDIRNGVVREGVIGSASSSAKPAAGVKDFPGFDMTMASTTMRGIDLPLWFRFAFEKAEPGEALKVALAEQTVGKVEYRIGDTAVVTIEQMSAKEMRLRPLRTPLSEVAAMAERAKDKTPESQQQMAGVMADLFSAMSFKDFELKGLSGEGRQQPGKPVMKFALDRMTMSGGGDVPGRFVMHGLKAGNGSDLFNVAEVAVEGVSLASMMGAFEKLAAASDPSAADVDPGAFVPKIDLVRLSGIDIDVPDSKDPKQRIKAKLGLFETRMSNHVGSIPANVGLTIDRLQMDIPANTKENGLQEVLALGYKGFDLSARYEQSWNEATKTLQLSEFSVKSAGMFAANAKATIVNVPRELFTLDKATASVAALGIAAKSLQINVTNDSLFEKLIAKQARDAKRKVEDVRAELAAGATMMVPLFMGDHPAAQSIGSALGRFVANSKTLRLSATAQGQGLGATDFIAVGNPMELLKKVDITAAANE